MGTAFYASAPWIADALVVFGMTVGSYAIVRMPDVYNKLHAASKAACPRKYKMQIPGAVDESGRGLENPEDERAGS